MYNLRRLKLFNSTLRLKSNRGGGRYYTNDIFVPKFLHSILVVQTFHQSIRKVRLRHPSPRNPVE